MIVNGIKTSVLLCSSLPNACNVLGKRTTHNPFEGREKPWDPYGIAKFDLSGLLLGERVLNLRSPIHPCPLPETNVGHENPDGPIVGRVGNIDGPGTLRTYI